MSSRLYRILYAFQGEEDGELSCSAGDIVRSAEDKADRNGWMLVETTTAPVRKGYIPAEYATKAETATSHAGAAAAEPTAAEIAVAAGEIAAEAQAEEGEAAGLFDVLNALVAEGEACGAGAPEEASEGKNADDYSPAEDRHARDA